MTVDPVPGKVQTGFMRALEILNAHRFEGLHPDDFYALMWPGKTGARKSTKGGPSGEQCAANWLLGRIDRKWPGSVARCENLNADRRRAGRWFIQAAGRALLGVPNDPR